MSPSYPQTVLVLGGIRSGKSEFAESLVGGAADVVYVATARASAGGDEPADPEFAARIDAHRARRPAGWVTEETGEHPERLAKLVGDAPAGRTLLVDDLGGWVTAQLTAGVDAAGLDAAVAALAGALAGTAARVVLVSPEVGLSVVPATDLGRRFADAVGAANRAVATACRAVALVVAGRPVWLSKPDPGTRPEAAPAGGAEATAAPVETLGFDRPARAGSAVAAGEPTGDVDDDADGALGIGPGMPLPVPDDTATTAATELIGRLPLLGAGLGRLTPAVTFIAGALGRPRPAPLSAIRVIAVEGTHTGALATGEDPESWAARASAARAGDGVLVRLAADVPGVTVEFLPTEPAAPIEDGDAATAHQVTRALAAGWRRAQAAADRGDELIVLAAGGAGMNAAASAVVAAITRGEVAALLGRVYLADGRIDDGAWMTRCVTIRDTLRRLRDRLPDGPGMLRALGGPSIAAACGVLLGAATRRTPVLVDGPVGVAAAVAARDYAAQVRLWVLLTDAGGDPTVRTGADRLGIAPLVDLGLGLGEGAGALALLPTVQAALTVAGLDGNR